MCADYTPDFLKDSEPLPEGSPGDFFGGGPEVSVSLPASGGGGGASGYKCEECKKDINTKDIRFCKVCHKRTNLCTKCCKTGTHPDCLKALALLEKAKSQEERDTALKVAQAAGLNDDNCAEYEKVLLKWSEEHEEEKKAAAAAAQESGRQLERDTAQHFGRLEPESPFSEKPRVLDFGKEAAGGGGGEIRASRPPSTPAALAQPTKRGASDPTGVTPAAKQHEHDDPMSVTPLQEEAAPPQSRLTSPFSRMTLLGEEEEEDKKFFQRSKIFIF